MGSAPAVGFCPCPSLALCLADLVGQIGHMQCSDRTFDELVLVQAALECLGDRLGEDHLHRDHQELLLVLLPIPGALLL